MSNSDASNRSRHLFCRIGGARAHWRCEGHGFFMSLASPKTRESTVKLVAENAGRPFYAKSTSAEYKKNSLFS